MNFIDNYGHLFTLPSYSTNPIGYEYEENPYIFWVDNNENNRLSINNYYIKVINLLLNKKPKTNIEITSKSNVFKLLKTTQINDLIGNNKSSKESISLSEDEDIKTVISSEDLLFVPVENNKYIVPLYVICNASTEGSWYSNILINIDNEEYCFITVGGVFIDECEPLVINGKNMGIDLPKDIIKAIYNNSYYNDEFNYRLYNEKLKEYLMNYIGIKGELGNFNSIENSIKWFGWHKFLSISKLLQTDNEYKNQFIRDYFELNTDILESFNKFRNSTFISLTLQLNKELEEINEMNFNNEFWGEGKPKLESLLDKQIKVKGGLSNSIEYIKYYYDYTFNELGLKLWCLGYFLEKYFLPIHLSIHSIGTNHIVYSNDIKFINKPSIALTESIIDNCDNNVGVVFPKNNIHYFTNQIHYVDSNLNEFKYYNKTIEELAKDENIELYYINDTCINIPIKFNTNTKNNEKYYNCNLILEKKNDNNSDYIYFLNLIDNKKINIKSEIKLFTNDNKIISDALYSFSYDGNQYSEYFDNYNALIQRIIYNSKAQNVIPQEVKISINYVGDNFTKFEKKYIELYNINKELEKIYLSKNEQIIFASEDGNKYAYYLIPNIDNMYQSYYPENTLKLNIYKIEEFYIKIKLNTNNVLKIIFDNEHLSLFKDYTIIEEVTYTKLFESKFSFIENESEKYNNFIIYPKIMGKNNEYINLNSEVSYWVNKEFRLSLLVNNRWYFYNFKSAISEPSIKVGTLEYKYWNDDFNISSNFKQLKGFEKNGDTEIVKFNVFSHEPDLFVINNINFYNDYIKYCINNNLQYIDKKFVNNDDFYQIILLNNQTIRFDKSLYGKNFYFSSSLLNSENISSIYIYLYNEYITYLALESYENDDAFVLLENSEDTQSLQTNFSGILLESDIDVENIVVEETIVYCIYNNQTKRYNVYVKLDNKIWDFGYPEGIIPLDVLHASKSDFEEKYVQQLNLSKTNKKLYNNVHVFNIWKTLPISSYLTPNYKGDIINCKGINFVFNDYKYENNLSKIKINIYGEINNNTVYNDYDMLDENTFIALLNEENNNYVNISSLTDFNLVSADLYDEKFINKKNLYTHKYVYYYDNYNKIISENIYHIEPVINKDNMYQLENDIYCEFEIFNINDIQYNDTKNPDITKTYVQYGKYVTEKYQLLDEEKNIYVSENNELVYIDTDLVLGTDVHNIYKVEFEAKIFVYDENIWKVRNTINIKDYIDFYNALTNDENNKTYKIVFYIRRVLYNKVYNEQIHYFGYLGRCGKCEGCQKHETCEGCTICSVYESYENCPDYRNCTNCKYLNNCQYLEQVKGCKHCEYNNCLLHRNSCENCECKHKIGYLTYSSEEGRYIEVLSEKNLENTIKIDLFKLQDIVYKINDGESTKVLPIKYPGAHWWTKSDFDVNTNGDYTFEYLDNVNFITLNENDIYNRKNNLYSDFWLKNYYAYKLLDNTNCVKNISILNKVDYEIIYKSELFASNSPEGKFIPVVYIVRENGKEEYIYGKNIESEFIEGKIEFTIYPEDKLCYIFYQIENVNDGDIISDKSYIEVTIEKKDYTNNMSLYKYDLDDLNEKESISITLDGKEYKYGLNISNKITELYKTFFIEEKIPFIDTVICRERDELDLGLTLDYDFYLMHDSEYWYGVYISRETIGNIISETQLKLDKNTTIEIESDRYSKYRLEYVKSENKIMFNRLKFVDKNGINHFKDDDLIVMKLENNNRLPVNVFNSSKWEVTPLSFNIPKDIKNQSNNEMCILSLPMNNDKYYKGYYNITVRYSLDRFTQQQFKNDTTILIK